MGRFGVILAALVCLSACGKEETAGGNSLPLRIGWSGGPDALNPGVAVLSQAENLFGLVYDTLYRIDLYGRCVPELAAHGSRSADGRNWTFQIRPGYRFHDGRPLTARDVAFSLNFYRNHPDFPLLYAHTQHFARVSAPNDSTVEIELQQAIGNMESQLAFLYILPEHLWAAHAQGDAAREFANEGLIGSGPFKLVEYRQNEFVHLAANREHPSMPPAIDEVIFQTFASQDALVQAMRTGQVDLITEMPNTAVPALRNASGVELAMGTPFFPEATDIIIDQLAPEDCPADSPCSGHPALRDPQVRLALAHAVDKQKIIDVVLLGLGTPGLTLVPAGLGEWYDDSLRDYPFDLTRANALLDEAGYVDGDGDGIREMPGGGRPLRLRVYWPSDSTVGPRLAQMLAETWTQAGIGTALQTMDPDALTASCCPAFDFDIIIWGWTSGPDPSFLLSLMTTEQIPTGSSESGYANPRYDLLYEQQAVELDPAKRRELVWEMQRIVHQDVVYIVPFYPQAVQAFRTDRFTGWPTEAPRVGLETRASLTAVHPLKTL